MQAVIDELESKIENLQIYLFGGGEQEKQQIANMVQQHRHCISVPEHLKGFQQELILMNELDAMISMDSSNMHLASLVATPVVSVWFDALHTRKIASITRFIAVDGTWTTCY